MKLRLPFALGLGLSLLAIFPGVAADNPPSVFVIAITDGTAASDVQARYIIAGADGRFWPSTEAVRAGNKLVIKNEAGAAPARAFKAILYAPGCQFVTIEAGDLAVSNSGEFQCRKQGTTELRGRLAGSDFTDLQVETVYDMAWAQRFFEVPSLTVSPIRLGKSKVQSDGSFTVELPDFTADPLWSSVSYNAGLMFYLVDGKTGRQIGALTSNFDSRAGWIKVEASYPGEIAFTLMQNSGR